jgi:uncharacterized protein
MKEQRINGKAQISTRVSEDGKKKYLTGYAAVFNSRSRLIYERTSPNDRTEKFFYEEILPGAFDSVMSDENMDVVATFNHKSDSILGRTSSGTLKLNVDETGLHFDVEVPDTSLGNDVFVMVQRGDFNQCSFSFTVGSEGEKWRKEGNVLIRSINSIDNLFDVCIAAINGAYAETTVSADYVASRTSDLIPKKEKESFEARMNKISRAISLKYRTDNRSIWIKLTFDDCVICEFYDWEKGSVVMYEIPYTENSGVIELGEPVEVEAQYVAAYNEESETEMPEEVKERISRIPETEKRKRAIRILELS